MTYDINFDKRVEASAKRISEDFELPIPKATKIARIVLLVSATIE